MLERTYAVSYGGIVRRSDTPNGPWVSYNVSSTKAELYDVETFPDNINRVVTVGSEGSTGKACIYYSTNGGVNWIQPSGNWSNNIRLYEVSIPTSTIAYACGVGGVVIKTIDGGLNWFTLSSLPTNTGLYDNNVISFALYFISSSVGVVSTNSDVFITYNGGDTWVKISENSISIGNILGIHLSQDATIVNFATDTGVFIFDVPTDGVPVKAIRKFYGKFLHLTNYGDNKLWAVGREGIIVRSIDGGQNYTLVSQVGTLDITTDRHAAHFINDEGYVSIFRTNYYSIDEGYGLSETDDISALHNYAMEPIRAIWNATVIEEKYCGCPEGFTYDTESETCYNKNSLVPSFNNGTWYQIKKGSTSSSFGSYGAVIVDDSINLSYPVKLNSTIFSDADNNIIPFTSVSNECWGDGSITAGRLNKIGVWSHLLTNPFFEWIGFTFCINAPEEGRYMLGFAGDNRIKISLNNSLIVNFDYNNSLNFEKWYIMPIDLQQGNNIIQIEGYNYSTQSSIALELYNLTSSDLISFNTTSELESSGGIITNVSDRLNDFFTIGQNSGYVCPEGYSLDHCDPDLRCVQYNYAPYKPCVCYEFKNCSDPQDVRLISILEGITGNVFNFHQTGDTCYEYVRTIEDCLENVEIYTVSNSYETCEDCFPAKQCYDLISCNQNHCSDITGIQNDLLADYLDTYISFSERPGCTFKVIIRQDKNTCKEDGVFMELSNIVSFDSCPEFLKQSSCEKNYLFLPPRYEVDFCTTDEYVEVVCKHADSVYNAMMKQKMGIKLSCDQKTLSNEINFKLMIFKSQKNPSLCNNIPEPVINPCPVPPEPEPICPPDISLKPNNNDDLDQTEI